jgi:hypothetical protein
METVAWRGLRRDAHEISMWIVFACHYLKEAHGKAHLPRGSAWKNIGDKEKFQSNGTGLTLNQRVSTHQLSHVITVSIFHFGLLGRRDLQRDDGRIGIKKYSTDVDRIPFPQ